jgi:hypothetical protein
MKLILLLFSAFLILPFGSCKKIPTIESAMMEIAFKDKSGNDLLDSTTQNNYSVGSIHLFNVVNGVKKEVNYPNYDFPHNFLIFRNDSLNQNFLRVFFETDTTLLQLDQNTVDTLTCVIDRSNGHVLKKFWYNGVLRWDNIMLPPAIIILK